MTETQGVSVETYMLSLIAESVNPSSLNNKITVYDSLFIALAKKLHTELITSDSRQAEAAEKEGVRVREV